MELIRGGLDDQEVSKPSTLSYNPSQTESTKLSSPILASTDHEGERRRDPPVHGNTIVNPPQTLEHPRLYLAQRPDPHPHEQDTHKPRRDPNPNDLDPVPALASSGTIKSPRTSSSTAIRVSPNSPTVRYRECLKNHAASKGGHVVDGCGEFMSSAGEEGTPEALKCAACECHRNFHRKEVEGDDSRYVSNSIYYINNGKRSEIVRPTHHHPQLPPSLPHAYHHHHQYHKFPQVPSTNPMVGATLPIMMAFGGGGGVPAESSSEDLNMFRSNNIVGVLQTSAQVHEQSRKIRFRTKFNQEQKDKMMEFAEKLEWKIQKHDEQQVQQFCSEVGVKRHVFKVWMHNNKQAMKKSKSKEN